MPTVHPRTEYRARHMAAPRRHRAARRILIAAVAMVAVTALVAVAYLDNLGTMFDNRANRLEGALPADGRVADLEGPRNILLVGSDSRGEGEDTAENKGEDGQRSDTMMVVHIPADRQNVYVMSVVRDLWVEIPGHGERKINAALNLGGYPLVVQTLEGLLGTRIDNVVSIDFEGFRALTEALNGVTLDNPVAFCSGQVAPDCFPVGEVTLEGTAALRYVRERKAFADGDFHRVQNQQRFVKAVVERFLNPQTLTNPAVISDVVGRFSGYVSVDETLDSGTIAALAFQLKNVRGNDIEMFTIPTGEPATGPGGASIITQDEAAMAELRAAFDADTLGAFIKASDERTNAYGLPIVTGEGGQRAEAGGESGSGDGSGSDGGSGDGADGGSGDGSVPGALDGAGAGAGE